jgi:plastocyanin
MAGLLLRDPYMRRILLTVLCLIAVSQAPGSAGPPDIRGVVTADGKPVANAVVWVEAPRSAQDPLPMPVLDQRNLNFYPRVLAVQVGTVVEFPNHDRVFHNVFSFHNGKVFDLGLYPTGTVKQITFDKAGLSRLFCNIHPHMAAYIVSVASQYFAVSDAAGEFTIRGLAPGTYTYHVWRAGVPEITGSAVMDAMHRLEIRWP